MNRSILVAILLILSSGQKSEAVFTTVYNIPPDIAPSAIGSDTQLNLFAGGILPVNFDAGVPAGTATNIEVNINDGTTGFGLDVFSGATLNILGGAVGDSLEIFSGGVVNYSGGTIGQNINSAAGGLTTISGGEFLLNGVSVSGATSLPFGSIITGTLADGTVFVLARDIASNNTRDQFPTGTLTLVTTALPAASPVVNSPVDPVPRGVRSGQTVTLNPGAVTIDNFAAVGGILHVAGGSVGTGLETVGTQVNITSGSVGDQFHAFTGSDINLSGGAIGHNARFLTGSHVAITGGTVGQGFQAVAGSTVDITGGEFQLDGVPVSGPTIFQ